MRRAKRFIRDRGVCLQFEDAVDTRASVRNIGVLGIQDPGFLSSLDSVLRSSFRILTHFDFEIFTFPMRRRIKKDMGFPPWDIG